MAKYVVNSMFLFVAAALSLSSESVAVGEWDVFAGTKDSHGPGSVYSFEFHKRNGNTLMTVWRSNEQNTFRFDGSIGRLAEVMIKFKSDNTGEFSMGGEYMPFEFQMESGVLIAGVAVKGVNFKIVLISDKEMVVWVNGRPHYAEFQVSPEPLKIANMPGRRHVRDEEGGRVGAPQKEDGLSIDEMYNTLMYHLYRNRLWFGTVLVIMVTRFIIKLV